MPPATRPFASSPMSTGHGGGQAGRSQWLRVNESLPLLVHQPALGAGRWTAPAGRRPSGRAWQWGVVPVEKDGSLISWCRPTAPFFSGLDENFRETPTGENLCELRARGGAFLHGLPRTFHRTRLCKPRQCRWPWPGRRARLGRNVRSESQWEMTARARSFTTPPISAIFNAKCVSCHGAKNPARPEADRRSNALLQHLL